jgi:glyoxylase-like metal-dependent hydrolase (beta-lactamase superfamily II)
MLLPGRIELDGGVTVDALLDAVADHPRRPADAFGGVPQGGWERGAARHPATVGAAGRWRLAVYAYLVQTSGHTLLIDAGVGPACSVAGKWQQTEGALPGRLAAVGVAPESIDVVFFTHLHEDHVGWGAHPDTGALTFERARYAIADEAWAAERRRGVRRHVREGLGPACELRRFEPVSPGPLLPGIEIVALPGHADGHSGVLVHGEERVALLAGDTFNHPVQIREPQIASGADAEPEGAIETRRLVLERAGAERHVVGSAHLPGGWWRVGREDSGRGWDPLAPAAQRSIQDGGEGP